MRILLTAVGKSDPMTIFKNLDVNDGSILQICRYYKPEKIYMYMSQQICEFDKMDNRYEKAIQYLGDTISYHFEIIKIKRPDLQDVHKFDYFYDEFDQIISQIIAEYGKDTEVLLNVSSGTPAMKSSFQIIAALSKYDIIPVQVSDPSNGKYQRDDDLKQYNVLEYWNQNLDNLNNAIKRCFESDNSKFYFKIQKEIIINLIQQYDYEAANVLIQDNIRKFNEEIVKCSDFSLNRYKLDKRKCRDLQKELGMEFLPYKQDDKIELFEYGLWLKLKADKGDLLDVVRGINPFMFEAAKMSLKSLYQIDISKYITGIDLTRKQLEKDMSGKDILASLDKKYKNGYKDTFLTEGQMITYIEYRNQHTDLIFNFKELNCFREKLRNIASHQITCIKEEIIEKELGHNIDYYINCIKKILTILGYDTTKYWNSYDQMNDYLIKLIL